MTPLSGRELAADIRAGTAARAAELAAAGHPPRLTVVSATDDDATAWYVRSIAAAAAKAGIGCEVEDLGPAATVAGIEAQLTALGDDPTVHAVILATPLPGGARLAELGAAIDPAKDVDGANPLSLGRLMTGLPTFVPATAEAVLRLLDHHRIALDGQHAVVVGRSAVAGKPVAHLLLDRNATVTICHTHTRDLAAITTQADILVVAAGRAGLIGPEHVAPGATVIDVGTNATADGGLVGDVDAKVADVAGALSPVPGGVGPVTTALLLRHVTEAADAATRRRGKPGPGLAEHAAVDRDQGRLLLLAETLVDADRVLGLHQLRVGAVRVRLALGHRVDQAGLGHQRFRGQIKRVGDGLEYPHRGLVQAPLDLAEVGVRQMGQLGELPQRQVRHPALAADEGAERLPLRLPRVLHGHLLA
jgi:methylenetetrahydrofolate dehydrogenase (NADP+) / methenyltetrahydrofolate cyclohydrolase